MNKDGYQRDGYDQTQWQFSSANEYRFPQPTFVNESGLDFTDISSEEYRIYEFSNGKEIRIDQPLRLNVSSSGGHRLFDGFGMSHYIPKGWVHLKWKVKPGQPNFVK